MKSLNLIATIVPLLLVAIGLVTWILTLRMDVTSANEEISALHEEIGSLNDDVEELSTDLDRIRSIQKIQDNEMRTIMSDHEGFGEALQEIGKSSILPSGERRMYGGYGN